MDIPTFEWIPQKIGSRKSFKKNLDSLDMSPWADPTTIEIMSLNPNIDDESNP